MSYASTQDLVLYAGEAEITRLSTPDGAELSGVWAERVQPRLDTASDLMDSYFRRRYIVPIAPVTPVIVECCCALGRYALYAGTGQGAPEGVREARDMQVAWLRGIGDGKVNLDGATLSGPPAGARVEERQRAFNNRGPLYR